MFIDILIILLGTYLLGVFCNIILFGFIDHFFGNNNNYIIKHKINLFIFILGSWYVIKTYYFRKDFTMHCILESIIKDMKGGQYGINTRRERNS